VRKSLTPKIPENPSLQGVLILGFKEKRAHLVLGPFRVLN